MQLRDVYLVRHGATEWSRNGRHTGRTDLPLLEEGEEEARRLATRLAGIEFGAVFSSDLRRARRTAALAGFHEPTLTPLLREVDYGEYEGLTGAQIHHSRPGWEVFRDGAPGGESGAQIEARARLFLASLDAQAGPVLAFSHGHFVRALATTWAGLGLMSGARLGLDTGSLSVLREGDRGRLLQVWNAL